MMSCLRGDGCTQEAFKTEETLNWKFVMDTDGIITNLTICHHNKKH